jgi:hypothetical protein
MAGQVTGNTATRRQGYQPSRDKITFNPADIVKDGVIMSPILTSLHSWFKLKRSVLHTDKIFVNIFISVKL